MNELVELLSKGKHEVLLNRVDSSFEYLKERLALNCVHVYFTSTQTELGIRLDTANCDYSKADMLKGSGTVYLQGAITLNYNMVRCLFEVDLKSMKGHGYLAFALVGVLANNLIPCHDSGICTSSPTL